MTARSNGFAFVILTHYKDNLLANGAGKLTDVVIAVH
jgi:hypothetical protein